MKAFLTYSGKGGVGKSTVTYCLYKAFKALGKTIKVLDMDLNTPSMRLLMKNETQDLIHPEFKGIYISKESIELFVRSAIRTLKNEKPEILLVDTPPSISDIHVTIINKLKISGCILVSQPTELARSDVYKTIPFFQQKDITIVGIIENMSSGEELDYSFNKLLSIPLESKLDSLIVYENNKANLLELAAKLNEMNLIEVSQSNNHRIIFDENITEESVLDMFGLRLSEDGEVLRKLGTTDPLSVHFVNKASWPALHQYIEENNPDGNWSGMTCPIREATPERINRLVDAFKECKTALFMITQNPNTSIKTITGEVGTCTLKVDKSKFKGIPCVEYQTNTGVITMFPHEVKPVDENILNDCALDGYTYNKSHDRYVPPLEVCLAISNAFGNRVGMPETPEAVELLWEEVMGLKQTVSI